MVNECCIKGCQSKSSFHTAVSKEHVKSFFKVPEDGTNERKKWNEIVGAQMKETSLKRKCLFVCEDHYEDECFFQNSISTFVNGKRETVPRKRRRLLPESLPTKFPAHASLKNSAVLDTSRSSVFTAPTSASSIKASQSLSASQRQPFTSLSNLLLSNQATISTSTTKPLYSVATTELSSPTFRPNVFTGLSNALSKNVSRSFLGSQRQPCTPLSNLMVSNQASISASLPKPLYSVSKTDLVSPTFGASLPSPNRKQISISPENASCPVDVRKNNTSSNSSAMDKEEAYTVGKLIDDWNDGGLLQAQSWGFIESPGVGVQFACYSHWEPSKWRGLLVMNDLTIRAIARGNVVNYQTEISRISCLQDLLSAIREVSGLQVCEGIFEERCPTGLYIRTSNRKSNRCFDCQKKYRRKYEKLRQQQLRAEKKKLTQKRKTKNLMQQVARSSEKIAKLEEIVEKLHKELEEVQDKFSSVSEDFMKHPFIQKLKPGMQETIRACWDLSKKNKKSLRYTKDWILKCHLLRIKSIKAYQHLRDHDILPLPCLNTINNYIKNLKLAT